MSAIARLLVAMAEVEISNGSLASKIGRLPELPKYERGAKAAVCSSSYSVCWIVGQDPEGLVCSQENPPSQRQVGIGAYASLAVPSDG